LEEQPELAVVFGRRRERFPERNIYHQTCEIEWNVPAGHADSCGGDALFRLAPVMAVGGFNPRLIAGEEPDLCYRLRQRNFQILSDARDMTLHDVDITSFRQWWRRALRAGHGIAELAFIHGLNANKGWRRFLLSGSFWGAYLILTVAVLGAALVFVDAGLALVAAGLILVLALQVLRTSARARHKFTSAGTALKWAALLLLSKAAQLQGALLYLGRRLTSSRKAIIEYK
jgi:GT2 family glycosyltransferase